MNEGPQKSEYDTLWENFWRALEHWFNLLYTRADQTNENKTTRTEYDENFGEWFRAIYALGKREAGKTEGYSAGKTEGYSAGWAEGYSAGHAEGHNAGYTEGRNAGHNSATQKMKQSEQYQTNITQLQMASSAINEYNKWIGSEKNKLPKGFKNVYLKLLGNGNVEFLSKSDDKATEVYVYELNEWTKEVYPLSSIKKASTVNSYKIFYKISGTGYNISVQKPCKISHTVVGFEITKGEITLE